MATSDKNLKTTWDNQSVSRMMPQLLRHRRFIVLCTLAGLLIACGALLSVKPQYEVSGTLMLQLGRENTAPPTVSESRVMPVMKRSEDLATEIEIMSSQQWVKDVVAHFGEDFFYKQPPAVTITQKAKRLVSSSVDFLRDLSDNAISGLGLRRKLTRLEKVELALQTGLEIEPARKSDVTRISMQISDPDAGEQILRKFIELYLAKHVEVYRSAKAKPFLESETGNLLAEIRRLQEERITFKNGNNIFSGEMQRKLILDQVETSRATQSELRGEIIRLKAELASSEKRLASMPRELTTQNVQQRNPLLAILENKVATLQGDRDAARLRYNETSRSIVDLDEQISLLKPKLEQTPSLVVQSITTALNTAMVDLEREIDAKRIQVDGIESRMAEVTRNTEVLDKRLQDMEVSETRLRDIERELELKEISYTMYRKSTEQARINDAMDIAQVSNVVVIDPPTASLRPVWPNFKIWLAAGGLAGFCTSVCLVLVGDTLRPTARSSAEVSESSGLEVLSTIPELSPTDIAGRDNASPASQQLFRRLADDLQSQSTRARSILVAACRSHQGGTSIASNLAIALADGATLPVLLIDANAHDPSLHEKFGINLDPGINEWSATQSLPVQKTSIPNLLVLPAGQGGIPKDRAIYLQKLQAIAQQASKDYEFIIWDAPPILEQVDARKLAGITDGLLLVVEANQTQLSDLKQVREQFSRAGLKPLGTVFNRTARYVPGFLRSRYGE